MGKPLSAILIISLMLSGCYGYQAINPDATGSDGDQGQNWSQNDQKAFYQTPQGSQFLNYYWFLALEQPDNENLFTENSLDRFGYLKDTLAEKKPDGHNPDGLPIGFVKDDGPGFFDDPKVFGAGDHAVPGPWIGLTCAACHTAEIKIDGNPHIIDGAPTNADFAAFVKELSRSLINTAVDNEKFSRFADRVAAQSGGERDKNTLRDDLRLIGEKFAAFVINNMPPDQNSNPDPTRPSWGKARMDAVGLILNEVAYKQYPEEENIKKTNAPVSYPFLWETHQQLQVQWNGVSVATLSRNTTQVLGAFGTFNPQNLQENSVDFQGLKELQALVVNLRSPRWEDKRFMLPALDETRLKRGAELYEKHCTACHAISPRDKDPERNIKIKLNTLDEIDTDPTMAKNFIDRKVTTKDEKETDAKGAIVGALNGVWLKSISGAWIPGFGEEIVGQVTKFIINLFSSQPQGVNVYKARPLNGIWATGPFLHNGSVKNIYQIMLPAEKRDKKFCVGDRELDTKDLGFKSDLSRCEADGWFVLDTSVQGNLNIGHVGPKYGTDVLTHEDRMDILEFIKSE